MDIKRPACPTVTSRKNTFYDKIKQQSKRNRFKQKRGDNFEIKFNNTKAVTNKQLPSYLQLTRHNLIFLKKLNSGGYNSGCGVPTAVIAPQHFFFLFLRAITAVRAPQPPL